MLKQFFVLVYNIPLETTKKELKKFLRSANLHVVEFCVMPSPDSERKTAFVIYATMQDAALAVMELDYKPIGGVPIRLLKHNLGK